jgi:hypothetical protein
LLAVQQNAVNHLPYFQETFIWHPLFFIQLCERKRGMIEGNNNQIFFLWFLARKERTKKIFCKQQFWKEKKTKGKEFQRRTFTLTKLGRVIILLRFFPVNLKIR